MQRQIQIQKKKTRTKDLYEDDMTLEEIQKALRQAIMQRDKKEREKL